MYVLIPKSGMSHKSPLLYEMLVYFCFGSLETREHEITQEQLKTLSSLAWFSNIYGYMRLDRGKEENPIPT
jgi:hypothetical protein